MRREVGVLPAQWTTFDVAVSASEYTDESVQICRQYIYRVQGVRPDGEGESSNSVELRVLGEGGLGECLPGVPLNLRAVAGDGRIGVEWDAPAHLGIPHLDGYRVYIRQGESGNWIGGISRYVKETFTIYRNRRNGQPYQVRVVAVNRYGSGPSTAPATATSQAGLRLPDIRRAPSAPRNLTLTPGDGRITVSWRAPADAGKPAAFSYLVEHRMAGSTGAWTETPSESTTATLTGLVNGQTYEVRVTAFNSIGGGIAGPQSIAPVGPARDPEHEREEPAPRPGPKPKPEPEPEEPQAEGKRPPSAPRNLSLEAGDGWIKVSWHPSEDPGEPEGWYIVEYRRVGESDWVEDRVSSRTTTLSRLRNGQAYEVRVGAYNQWGRAIAGPHTARPTSPEPAGDRPPSEPRNLTLTVGDGHIDVSWEAPFDVGEPELIGYVVQIRRAGERTWVDAGFHRGTSATVDFVQNGVHYEVRVVAFNQWGNGIAGPRSATPRAG